MTKLIDTSVVMKWFVAESGQNEAEALIGAPLMAPDFLMAEVSNAAWRKHRQGEIGREQAALAQSLVVSFVELRPSLPFAPAALEIAFELEHPVYDCFYLSMAEASGLPFVTSDKRLLRACAGTRFEPLVEPL